MIIAIKFYYVDYMECTFLGLTAFTNYATIVAATTLAGIGPYSSPINVQTNESGMLPYTE